MENGSGDEAAAADRRERFARTALANVVRQYPHKPGYVLDGPDDLREPRRTHPAFYGSFDWHSAVHNHWSLIRLVRAGLPDGLAVQASEVLAEHLSDGNLEVERTFLAANPTFERPYGWGWALALSTEVRRWEEAPDGVSVDAANRLAATVSELLIGYLETSHYPVRSGTHSSTAFAMILAHDHAAHRGDDRLRRAVEERARGWFEDDPEAAVWAEPSGEDFLSPTLTQAHLTARILHADALATWIGRVLPAAGGPGTPPLSTVPEVGDPSDPKLVHLRGLALSRAWSWRAVADALPDGDDRVDPIRAAAQGLVEASLPHVVSDDYGGDHWLVSFAILADEGL